MKQLKAIIPILAMTILMSFSSFDASAFHSKIDQYITATNGCKFHATGWVDWGLGGIKHYDVTISGPCGTYTFQGLVVPNSDPENDGERELEDFEMALYDDSGAPVPLNTIEYENVFNELIAFIDTNPPDETE